MRIGREKSFSAAIGYRIIRCRIDRQLSVGVCRITSAATTGSCETNCSSGKHLTRCLRPTVLFVRWQQHTSTIWPQCLGIPAPGASRRGWSIGGQNPNLLNSVIHGGRPKIIGRQFVSELVVRLLLFILQSNSPCASPYQDPTRWVSPPS